MIQFGSLQSRPFQTPQYNGSSPGRRGLIPPIRVIIDRQNAEFPPDRSVVRYKDSAPEIRRSPNPAFPSKSSSDPSDKKMRKPPGRNADPASAPAQSQTNRDRTPDAASSNRASPSP